MWPGFFLPATEIPQRQEITLKNNPRNKLYMRYQIFIFLLGTISPLCASSPNSFRKECSGRYFIPPEVNIQAVSLKSSIDPVGFILGMLCGLCRELEVCKGNKYPGVTRRVIKRTGCGGTCSFLSSQVGGGLEPRYSGQSSLHLENPLQKQKRQNIYEEENSICQKTLFSWTSHKCCNGSLCIPWQKKKSRLCLLGAPQDFSIGTKRCRVSPSTEPSFSNTNTGSQNFHDAPMKHWMKAESIWSNARKKS